MSSNKSSFSPQFRYSTALDRLMVVIGVILSLAAGVALPVHMLLFGEVINQFVFYTQAQPLISVAESLQGTLADDVSVSTYKQLEPAVYS